MEDLILMWQHLINKKMKKIYLLLSLISIVSYSQQKKDWFFGAELGLNTITSFNLGEPNKSFQGGILAEYYMGNHWSLTGKIKYFETGVSFFKAGFQVLKAGTLFAGVEIF